MRHCGIQLSSQWPREKCMCLFSKRWLMLLSRICKDEIAKSNGTKCEGCVVRSLFSREATYVKLVAIAVGTENCGGLAKLSIRGKQCLSWSD
ncbi:hypothetical protein H5410_030822 [Solanum commersonii]|uniref:Uncharacterized protein n=1 Tax=Solanum commersonii TaxID=4109 RepID=A0A9J5YJU9_SOLCO|nr:hypothetical protein H5410_030822 [Solanum commersonii]